MKQEKKQFRTTKEFYAMEKAEKGTIWKELQKGLPVMERRYASYAYKQIVEEMTGKRTSEFSPEYFKTVPYEYVIGLMLSVATEAEAKILLSGQPISDTAKLHKRAIHAGRIYACAVSRYEDKYRLLPPYKQDLDHRYTVKDRDDLLKRAMDIARTLPINRTWVGGLAYRQVVIGLLPKAEFEYYMRNPETPVADEDCEIALARANHCGSGYVKYVERYMKGDKNFSRFIPMYHIVIDTEKLCKTDKKDIYDITHLQNARTIETSELYDNGRISMPSSKEADGAWVKITPNMHVEYPDYLDKLMGILKTLTDFDIHYYLGSTFEYARITVRAGKWDDIVGTMHITSNSISLEATSSSKKAFLKAIVAGQPEELDEDYVDVSPKLSDEMDGLLKAIGEVDCYAKSKSQDTKGEDLIITVYDDDEDYGYISLTVAGGYNFHMTDKELCKKIRGDLIWNGYM